MSHPVSLFPAIRRPDNGTSFPPASIKSLHAHTEGLANAAARTALDALQEGAKQALEVTSDPSGQYLDPRVKDALKRLGELVTQQSEIIRRLL